MGYFKIIGYFFVFVCLIHISSTERPRKKCREDETKLGDVGNIARRQYDIERRSMVPGNKPKPDKWRFRNPRSPRSSGRANGRFSKGKTGRQGYRRKGNRQRGGRRPPYPNRPILGPKYPHHNPKPIDLTTEFPTDEMEMDMVTESNDDDQDITTDYPDQSTAFSEPLDQTQKFLIRKYIAVYNEGDFINLGNDLKEIDTCSFTFSALFQTDTSANRGGRIFSKRNPSSNVGFEIYCINGEVTVWSNTVVATFQMENLEGGVWYLITVAVNRTDNTAKAFINGQANGETMFLFINGGIHGDPGKDQTWVAIGSWNQNGLAPTPSTDFKGLINTIWTYEKDLQDSEVELHCRKAEEEFPLFACR